MSYDDKWETLHFIKKHYYNEIKDKLFEYASHAEILKNIPKHCLEDYLGFIDTFKPKDLSVYKIMEIYTKEYGPVNENNISEWFKWYLVYNHKVQLDNNFDLIEIFRNTEKIPRCSECSKILRTLRSQQCLWCGYDWH